MNGFQEERVFRRSQNETVYVYDKEPEELLKKLVKTLRQKF